MYGAIALSDYFSVLSVFIYVCIYTVQYSTVHGGYGGEGGGGRGEARYMSPLLARSEKTARV